MEKKKFRLVVDGIRAQDGQLTNAELTAMQQFVSPVYLGSAPEPFHKELKVKEIKVVNGQFTQTINSPIVKSVIMFLVFCLFFLKLLV